MSKQSKKEQFMPIPEFKKGSKKPKMIPLGVVLKYDPPVIGLIYKKRYNYLKLVNKSKKNICIQFT